MSTKKTKLTSPTGIAVYPRLNRPDTKYNEHGTYSADIRLEIKAPGVKEMLKTITDEYAEHFGHKHPAKPVRKDKEGVFYFDQNEDGSYVTEFVTVKLRAKNRMTKSGDLWERKPRLFDTSSPKPKQITAPLNVGGGTSMKVSFEIDYGTITKTGDKYFRLIPSAVQIIDFIEFGGDSDNPADYGFGEEEGYEAPEATSSATPGTTNDNSEAQSEDNPEAFF